MISSWFKCPWLFNSFSSLGIEHFLLKCLFPFTVYVLEILNHWTVNLAAGAGPSPSFVLCVRVGPRGDRGGDADGGEWAPLPLLCALVQAPLCFHLRPLK